MDEDEARTIFAELSQALTGIAIGKLRPPNDPNGVFEGVYHTFARNAGPYAAGWILERFTTLKTQGLDDDRIASAILGDADNGPVAQSIIKLWLLGNWYTPGTSRNATVASSNVYIAGWVWKIMQAHPMGYSMQEYGYWAEPPPAPLAAYVPPPAPPPAKP
ncbi:hypothetical protein N825_25910 [Skermanella stibiiresistens SB22]|uniref:Membrane bound FAD containing D-sorbitol dehydrogenase n=1 Tax=Skermanella stibiiresistens SB22 TaxID=1385369 RepID=W9GSE9_9PROT|nr:hypothetical protein [Skermanella stibiiresistens]EWY36659.1 hypothetical protein N825_25910 [Skermanella stibiiresistens SB22]